MSSIISPHVLTINVNACSLVDLLTGEAHEHSFGALKHHQKNERLNGLGNCFCRYIKYDHIRQGFGAASGLVEE